MSQRYLQECPLSTHRQVHGCPLCSSKGWCLKKILWLQVSTKDLRFIRCYSTKEKEALLLCPTLLHDFEGSLVLEDS